MNTDNINALIARIQAQGTPINFKDWKQCYAGMAEELSGISPEERHPALFSFDRWLGVPVMTAARLTYLHGFGADDDSGDARHNAFNALDLDAQKRVLIRGLESLRDTGEIVWE